MGKFPTSHGAGAESAARLASRGNVRSASVNDGDFFEVNLLQAMLAFRSGDFSIRLPLGWTGIGENRRCLQ
jgi:hypothetical protein